MVELSAVGGAGGGEGRMKLDVVVGVRDVVVGDVGVRCATVVVVGAALATTHSARATHAARNDLLDLLRVMEGMDSEM